ncbi:hypothetical protein [Oceaniglobus trochenteri]|nr:hypothetical protein [Oceaniglobus trochenteri]
MKTHPRNPAPGRGKAPWGHMIAAVNSVTALSKPVDGTFLKKHAVRANAA